MLPPSQFSPYVSLFSFVIGLPTAVATYYQAWRGRQESHELRESLAYSSYCLEFIDPAGSTVNLVPLDSLHSLPKMGDVVLLPGMEDGRGGPAHGAYRVLRVEHLYARDDSRGALAGGARLVKTVAQVELVGGGDGL